MEEVNIVDAVVDEDGTETGTYIRSALLENLILSFVFLFEFFVG